MLISPKFLIVALVLVGGIFASFTVIRMGQILTPNPVLPSTASTTGNSFEVATGSQTYSNAFLPRAENGADSLQLQNQIERHVPPSIIAEAKKTTLSEIQKKVEVA